MQHPSASVSPSTRGTSAATPRLSTRRPPRPITGRSAGLGLLLGAAVALVGCDSGRDSMLAPEPAAATFSAAVGAFPGWSSTDARELQAQLKREQQRTQQEKLASRPAYQALKANWRALKKRGSLLQCEPLRYEAESKIVGPAGGVLQIGPHRLVIPAGALKQYTVITGELPVGLTVAAKFSPHGLQFAREPMLVLNYGHCAGVEAGVNYVEYLSDSDVTLDRLVSSDDAGAKLVATQIGHFSRYGVATGRTDPGAGDDGETTEP